MANSELVTVARFFTHAEADIAKSALDAAEIESMISSDDAGGVRPGMDMGSPIRLMVRAEDAARAREVLETPAQPVDGSV